MAREHREVLRGDDVEPGAHAAGRARRRQERPRFRRQVGGRRLGARRGRRRRRGGEERRAHRRGDPDAQVADARGAAAVRVDAVGEHDQVGVARRIDPDRRAGEPGVPDRAHGKERRQHTRERRREVPPERAHRPAVRVGLPHERDGLGLEVPVAVERPLVHEHPAEPRQVGGRREEARVAGDAPERARARIVRLALEHVAIEVFRRRHPAPHGVARVERRVAQAERAEEHPVEIAVEGVAAHAPDDLAEQDEAGVAVLEAGARRIVERDLGERPGRCRKSRRDRARGRDRQEARAVGQDPPDGDPVEGPAPELPQVAPERRVELDRAPLDEGHDGKRGAEGLRERGDVEDRVGRHRRGLGDEPAPAVRTVQEDLVAQPDEDDDARDLSGNYCVARGLVDGDEVRLGGADRWGEREQQECDVRETLRAHVTILALV